MKQQWQQVQKVLLARLQKTQHLLQARLIEMLESLYDVVQVFFADVLARIAEVDRGVTVAQVPDSVDVGMSASIGNSGDRW